MKDIRVDSAVWTKCIVPASAEQRRIWFSEKSRDRRQAYKFALNLEMSGRLDAQGLIAASIAALNQHEILRTSFEERNGELFQVIRLGDMSQFVKSFDLMGLSEEDVSRTAEEFFSAEVDLADTIPIRIGIIRSEKERWLFLVATHHLVFDGQSIRVFTQSLKDAYMSWRNREDFEPTIPRVQYADYVKWQIEDLARLPDHRSEFWCDYLGGAQGTVPPGLGEGVGGTGGADEISFSAGAVTGLDVVNFARANRVSPFVVVTAALLLVLAKSVPNEEIVVGATLGNRPDGFEQSVGCFVNIVILRVGLILSETVEAFLRKLRTIVAQAMVNSLPYDRVLGSLRKKEEISNRQLFHVLLTWQNEDLIAYEDIDGLELHQRKLEIERSAAPFGMHLSWRSSPSALVGSVEYATDLFERQTVERMVGHWQNLLRSLVANPQRRLSELEMLSEAERVLLLDTWNRTERPYPKEKTVPRLFEEQVERTPESPAVIFEQEQLSYRELNERSNQVAHYLRHLGVGPETRVGICVERSLEMVIGLLGILKAGGAYVPLDPEYPQERLAFMMEDAQVAVLLTHSRMWTPNASCPKVFLDEDWPSIATQPITNPDPGLHPDNAAYVIYTSGSTGKPKGVEVLHKGIINVLDQFSEMFAANVVTSCSATTTLVFDISVLELFLPLIRGNRLYVKRGWSDCWKSGSSQGVGSDLMQATPTAWKMLANASVVLPNKAKLLCGGESLDAKLAQHLVANGNAVWNCYGPSEATVWSTTFAIAEKAQGNTVPIGRPIANTQIYLLDGAMEPVPVGVGGELYIGGAGLARGYLNRPGLTAERFVPNPFGEAGSRLYRTGDLGRYRPDGNIDFLGRIDDQVKIRGYRIEPGEVEVVLGSHPMIREAVVIARTTEQGDKRLVGYLVADQERVSVGELREYMQQRLPDHMVPSAFVYLEALPLTVNGKLDRRALPEPEQAAERPGSYVAPRNVTEEILCGIWEDVLGVERVGIEDNFFELGGHSILATQVISRIRKILSIEVELRRLFEKPTVGGFAVLAEQLRPLGTSVDGNSGVVKLPRPDVLPLSYAQERLWFIDRMDPGSLTYAIPIALDVSGALDVEALSWSFEEIVRRHEVLRTRFGQRDGHGIQLIDAVWQERLEVEDLSSLPAAVQADEVDSRIIREAERPFDLESGPVFRATLLKLAESRHVLLISMHHIVSDGWSMGVLVREIGSLYTARITGTEVPLGDLPIQYADYAVWERQWMQGDVLENELAYWRTQLQDLTPLELPTDHPRPAVATHSGASVPVALDAELVKDLTALARQEGVTLFMLLLAAFYLLLSRYSGQKDITVGTDVANRNRLETEALIGFFVNQLVLRADLDGDPTVGQFLGNVRDLCLNAYAYQNLPFGKLVQELNPQRDLGREPLFQLKLVLQNAPLGELKAGDLEFGLRQQQDKSAKLDLQINVAETDGLVAGNCIYATGLFERETVERMVGHWQNLLRSLVANPQRRLSELEMLSEAERVLLLDTWNRTERPYPKEKTVPRLFEEQVERTPESPAVIFEEEQLSYRELNERSNQVAHYLRHLGVGPETRVGICVERSLEMVIGLLGILKAGGAYVPLDPEYPQERLAFMMEDAQVAVLLTHSSIAGNLPSTWVMVLSLDEDWPSIATQPITNPDPGLHPDNAAYVIYTSGSTGRPKGVQIIHRGMVGYLFWAQAAYLGEHCNATTYTSLGFDFTVTSLYLPLLSGGVAQLGPRGNAALSQELGWFAAEDAFIKLTPSHLELLSRSICNGRFPVPKNFIIGGESLLGRHLVSLAGTYPNVLVHNEYGPTETVVGCCTFSASTCDTAVLDTVPIGRPIANTQIYLLDGAMEPVPVGVGGELYIGGAGLARGYLNRPGLTAERFVPNPFGEAGSRLYRTGDLGRYRPDGNIDFLGRIDDQVKIRGYRIEPGEVEVVLGSHPMIREAVVIARTTEQGDKRLVGYLVADQERVSVGELREYMQQRLPDHMVPSAFVYLEALPLTVNGKLDRRALPEPEQAAERPGSYVAPRNVTEEILCGIWEDVLGVERVGIEDNFFELGGDSILSIRVLAKARNLGIELTVADFFERQTVGQILSQPRRSRLEVTSELSEFILPESDLVKLPQDVEKAYPLSALQAGMLFHSHHDPNTPVYHDIFTYRLRMTLNWLLLREAVQMVVDRHDVLRTSFDLASYSQPLQLVYKQTDSEMDLEDVQDVDSSEQGEMIRAWLDAEKLRSFDFTRPGLIRFKVHVLTPAEFQFSISFHHVILDGWSTASLLSEIFRIYKMLRKGIRQDSDLCALKTTFQDFVALELATVSQTEARDYWAEQLSTELTVSLPWHRNSRTKNQRVGTREVPLPEALTHELHLLGRRLGVSMKSISLAAHIKVLSMLSGSISIQTGLVSNGRLEVQDGDRVLGLFLNTVPYRLDTREESWEQFILRVARKEKEILPYRRFPLAALQQLSGKQELFDTAFNFVHFHVYRSLADDPELEVVDGDVFEQTNFAFISMFSLSVRDSRLELILNYDADLLSDRTVDSIESYFASVLTAMCTSARSSSSRNPLSEAERVLLLDTWNRTERPYPKEKTVPRLFEEQVERTPESPAVIFEEEQLSYRELNERSNQVAHYLRHLGVGPETRVGICVERSLEMVIGLLGILKAGGAYVPLDPEYPQERLAFMMEDAQVAVLLTHSRTSIPSASCPKVSLDEDWPSIATQPITNPDPGLHPDNAAYVIYTSGSTGKPKGVEVLHKGIARLVCGADYVEFIQGGSLLQLASISFDAATFEIWGSLLNGMRLVLYPAFPFEGSRFVATLQEHSIDIVWLTERLFHQIVAEHVVSLVSVGQVLAGGDALQAPDVRRVCQQVPELKLINGYGPTECTTFTCTAVLSDSGEDTVPIGRPIANTQIYLLDGAMEPVPVGVGGELYIGGAGLARGYLNRPGLTAERFVPNPFGEAGSRLYRTGDLGRYRPDGNIDFLGRIDDQVKIRGYRIEPGEVEVVLGSHPMIREAVVIARTTEQGDKRLVGYLVADQERVSVGELREYMQQRLPDHMVPSAFVYLEALPLTVNGKLDRRALPEPEQAAERPGSYVAPRNVTEEILCGIWEDVLGVERVGIEDNFFELGGHSILATQVISRIRKILSIEVELRRLFEKPTVGGFAVLAEQLRPLGTSVDGNSGVVKLPRPDVLPLSYAQERLWFIDRMDPGSLTYAIPIALDVSGALDVEALSWSFEEIVRRHEVLRTRFGQRDGHGIQLIDAVWQERLEVEDLSSLPAAVQADEVDSRIIREAERPFDLESGPVFRATLLKLAESRHVLLISMHHIVSDGWSMGVLVREIGSLYTARLTGTEVPLGDLPIQYADYAVWERQWMQGDVLENELAYWRTQLQDLTPLELPTDHPRPAVATHSGASVPVALDAELVKDLTALARQEGVTLFMLLLAAFYLLLSRYSGQKDITVGTDVANRNRLETEALIGFFVNQLVLRADLDGDPTVGQFLGNVRDLCLNAYAYQNLPFGKLVQELNPQRDLGREPLFQLKLVLQNAPLGELKAGDLEFGLRQQQDKSAKLDLQINVAETDGLVAGNCIYATGLFERETVERMVGHWQNLLRSLVANPQRRLSELEMLSEAERVLLLDTWNRTERPYPKEKTVPRLFEEQVERTPESPAVIFEQEQLSYRELNERSNQVAHYLRHLGVGPETRVGICVERSLEMVIGLLGILKAGGAYVPLDPEYPQERLAFMMEDAQVAVLLTHSSIAGNLPSTWVMVLSLDEDWPSIATQPITNPDPGLHPDNAAYVIYTSGSTGKPKGVEVLHRGLANLLSVQKSLFRVDVSAKILQFSSVSFDASTWELMLGLFSGGSLILISNELRIDEARLSSFLNTHPITLATLTPSTFQAVSKTLKSFTMDVVLAGEMITRSTLQQFFEAQTLSNAYGTTEATICSTVNNSLRVNSYSSIGRPIANTQIYLLDGAMEPVPVGVGGELYIGGAGLARGYLNRPGLTAERFVPNPFGEAGSRLYRTGDLGRYRPDGNIDFLGRIDDQVKIRGYRIEPGEVEVVLGSHPMIREAVVIARTTEQGDKRLVGYLVADQERVSVGELREYMQQRLPDHMVPSAFVYLEALPLTVNGKLDRRALPEPEQAAERPGSYVAPRNVTEEILCGIWEDVLGVERVGIEDSFFELGGHSLLATQVISQIRRLFQIDIPLRELFNNPNVIRMARVVHDCLVREIAELSETSAHALLNKGAVSSEGETK